ncbi:M23 family metallopeptidase [Bacillus sp. BGMRC 2118]|nr:M23 family metallopeptidase [Bacillus sp. BGMRC 2118]
MSKRADDIRKRIAMRKKERGQLSSHKKSRPVSTYLASDEEKYGVSPFDSYEGGGESSHPLFSKEWFMFKVLAAAALLLVVAIMYRDGSARFEPARDFVSKTMESEFQFAAVTSWYEDQFGKPLSLLPTKVKETTEKTVPVENYAVPASGRVLEGFEKNGQGIMVETGTNSTVTAINEGMITFIGQKDEIEGITVVVQHSDKSESWYGNLETSDVKLYDFVEQKTKIGTATSNENGVNGTFYFAIKKGDSFIDPIQVIDFE